VPHTAEGRGPVTKPRSLDRVDRAIIEALQENGRDSFRGIAAKIGVAEATVRSRYARLVDDDILQVTGVTNPLGLGFDAMALIGVNATGAPAPIADEIAEWEEASYVAELVCADRTHLLELTTRIRAIDNVVTTETFLYMQLCKQIFHWGTRA
jgi:Lrp/AsnC family transcriptional regulator, regulator for asnA, asnC and gidA